MHSHVTALHCAATTVTVAHVRTDTDTSQQPRKHAGKLQLSVAGAGGGEVVAMQSRHTYVLPEPPSLTMLFALHSHSNTMQRSAIGLLTIGLMMGMVQAHVCLLSPQQRGGPHTITAAADPWCKLLDGPCGGASPEDPVVQYRRNDTLTVVWQKNQDHWQAQQPAGIYICVCIDTLAQSED